MSFNTSWDVDKYKSNHEVEEHWLFKRSFIMAHKSKYPEDRLLCLAQTFYNIEFLGCIYPQQTMELIKRLSLDVTDNLKGKCQTKLQQTLIDNCNAFKGIFQTTQTIFDNQLCAKQMKCSTPYHSDYILPGFILIIGNTNDPNVIIDRSCTLCNMPKPKILIKKLDSANFKADFYLQDKCIASTLGKTEKIARKSVTMIAYNNLKEACFTIKEKLDDENEMKVNKIDVTNDEQLNNNSMPILLTENSDDSIPYYYDCQLKLTNDNIGNKMLQNMGWLPGNGLGRNNQGILDPIKIVQLPKKIGFGNQKPPIGDSARQKIMFALQREVKIHLEAFVNSPHKRLSFSTKFTKDERRVMHLTCHKFGLKTKSYGQADNRYLVILKKQNAREMFEELINCGYENDYYLLIPPKYMRI